MNIVIIGAGASGMMAALTAAESGRHRVILLERQSRVGRKLAATGNGRCNLTNTNAAAKHYHGEHPEFALPALEAFPPADTVAFFRSLGLVTVEEYGGRVYPLSNSANSVVDVLRFALEARGVDLRLSCTVRQLRRARSGYELVTDGGSLHADRLIVACGGAAGAKLGGVRDGYELLAPLSHKSTRLCPSLVQLITDSEYPRALKGIRAQAKLTLTVDGQPLGESEGELQFTDNGVSGPSVFDISRAASVHGAGARLHIDLLSDYPQAEVLRMLVEQQQRLPAHEAAELFTGMLHGRLGRTVVKYAGLSGSTAIAELTSAQLARCAQVCKDFALTVKGTESWDSAQVTAGGIKTGGFDPEALESRFMPGLFVCGELLDVDADCGGYNLQWAWASGRLAGLSAAKGES